tara:strand:- start:593 stop:994 length:402 start_codon:yes stop_codon:yes gene_type:complete
MLKNEFRVVAYTLTYHISCAFFSMNSFYIIFDYLTGVPIALSSIVGVFIVILLWSILTYISIDDWWKTVLNMLLYSSAILSIMTFLLSLIFLNDYFFGKTSLSLIFIIILCFVSVFVFFISGKLLKSKHLATN